MEKNCKFDINSIMMKVLIFYQYDKNTSMAFIYLNTFFFFISFTPLSNSDTVLYQIAGDKIQAASAFIFLLWQSCNCKPTMILLCFDDLELFHKNRIYK